MDLSSSAAGDRRVEDGQAGSVAFPAGALFDVTDRALHAMVARATAGLSPRALIGAYMDWATGLAFCPGRRAELAFEAARSGLAFLDRAAATFLHPDKDAEAGAETGAETPAAVDRRFRHPGWAAAPFSYWRDAFLAAQAWWAQAAAGVDGVCPEHERAVAFSARQWLDLISPSNFAATNPEVLERTMEERGMNLVRGLGHFLEDWRTAITGGSPPGAERFVVGRDVAATPGKVVYANHLIELIQYAPTTETVRPEPVLITPAWIMKYYILDLSPENSLVRHLIDQGFTVFMISWKNPDPDDRDLSLEDYRRLGPCAALDAIGRIMPDRRVHGVGYCLGGTLLAITAAAMARDDDKRFGSLTFLAAQADFEEAGELMLFINDQQVAFLEDMMWDQGYLDTHQMAGAFQMLRSNDLIWSKLVHDYLMGDRRAMNDLAAWNADATRMPYRMHSDYLRRLFLKNDLSEGRYRVEGRPVTVCDIRAPLFVVATERDHIAPWTSVYKFHLLCDTDITFLLTSGGHNAGIISPPGGEARRHRISRRAANDRYVHPDRWLRETEVHGGSWWPAWCDWLKARSGAGVAPPPLGGPDARAQDFADAPGAYVMMD